MNIEATWYVDQQYLRRCRWQKWAVRGSIAGIMFLLGFALGYDFAAIGDNAPLQGLLLGTAVGLASAGISLGLQMERRLRYSGKRRRGPHKGLYALTGHSPKFTETVERMIHGGF